MKHPTASVFLFTRHPDGWRIGLIRHPRLHRWMLPGGHVEPDENPAETAVREVLEETGSVSQLVNTHTDDLTAAIPGIPLPTWIAEQQVPADSRHPTPHIHIDHLYAAVADQTAPTRTAELRFEWFKPATLPGLDMFPDSRRGAQLLFGRLNSLDVRSKV